METKKEYKLSGYFAVFFLFLLVAFPLIVKGSSAYFYLSPEKGNYVVGDNFSIDIRFNTSKKFVNAAESILIFNPTKLKVLGIKKEDSLFNSWLPGTSFSNDKGVIVLRAGTIEKISANNGLLASIIFKAISPGETTIYFKSGSLLEANGQATNILNELKPATFILEPKNGLPLYLKERLFGKLTANEDSLAIFSTTHPKEDRWYKNNSPKFEWEIPKGTTAISFSIDKNPTSQPQKIYNPPVKEAEFSNLENGIWFFHLRFKEGDIWSKTINRRVMIDNERPSDFKISIDNQGDQTNPQPIFLFPTEDNFSGVDYYELKIDDNSVVKLISAKYKPKPLNPGIHSLLIKAFDRAGNFTANIKDFEIKPLESPKILEISSNITVGNPLTIKGYTKYPNSIVNIYLEGQGNKKKFSITPDPNGFWFFAYSRGLSQGVYQVSAEIKDKRGAISLRTERKTILISYPILIRIGKVAINYLTVFLSLLGLIILLIISIFYTWYKTKMWKNRISIETKEMYIKVAKAFSLLDKELKSQIEYLDNKPGFSEEEELIYHRLKMVVKHAENIIGEEVEELKKHLGIE